MFLTSSTIRKRKDSGKWQVIIRQKQNGTWKQVESKTFTGNTEAKQWATKKKAEWQRKVEIDYIVFRIKFLPFKENVFTKGKIKLPAWEFIF